MSVVCLPECTCTLCAEAEQRVEQLAAIRQIVAESGSVETTVVAALDRIRQVLA